MSARKGSATANDLAIGGLVLFMTLPLLWTFTPLLTAVVVPSSTLPPRMWIMGVIAPAILIGAAAYLRDPSILWQSPLQALALAFLFVGLSVPILNWQSVSGSSVAICVGYFVVGAALGWLLRKSQRRFLRRRKPPN
jgi:hypothetical protein